MMEQKHQTTKKISAYIERRCEEEKRLNDLWRSTEEWRELREQELAVAQAARASPKRTGVNVKMTQSW